jgi:hypothetical protein
VLLFCRLVLIIYASSPPAGNTCWTKLKYLVEILGTLEIGRYGICYNLVLELLYYISERGL